MITLKHIIKDDALLTQALTHRSKHKTLNNERLEFLGDSILSAIISADLYKRFPDAREGELSRLRSSLVKGDTIASIALTLEIDKAILLGPGETRSHAQLQSSILAGAFEAIIAAIYLSSNFDTVSTLVLQWYEPLLNDLHLLSDTKDAKSQLQEVMQSMHMPLPIYTVSISGLSHQQTFDVVCTVEGLDIQAHGQSTSRRRAEQLAAAAFLGILHERSD
jgi:ribonuclease-3